MTPAHTPSINTWALKAEIDRQVYCLYGLKDLKRCELDLNEWVGNPKRM